MTYRLSNMRAPLDFERLEPIVADALGLKEAQIAWARLAKKSVDARKKADVHFVLSMDFEPAKGVRLPNHPNLSQPNSEGYVYAKSCALPYRPLVVGLGPAGLLAGLTLARAGLRPLIIERGRDVDARARDVARFWSAGELNPHSNVQFGEGGAGTFSDGKLTTGIKDPRCKEVLRVFYEHGAPEEILYQAKPHIGTDNLPSMVRRIREQIISLGGEVRFGHRLTEILIDGGQIVGAVTHDMNGQIQQIDTRDVLLAIGHSARDTLAMLHDAGIPMQKKPFSIGARIEHSQDLIDRAQYGTSAAHRGQLGAADYKLHERLKNGRGAYTFCMCPGGSVVAAASEPGLLVVNGMSAYARDGQNANSALLISVDPSDFAGDHPLTGLRFQEKWERLAFSLGGDYSAPAQLVGDFLKGKASKGAMDVQPSYRPGVQWTNLADCLPDFVISSMREAILLFDRKLHGFAIPGAVLTGVETRSSSPVTIPRNPDYMCGVLGLYPCGEGAGHAGGIMSAAVDGMRCAEALIHRYNP